MQNSLFRIRDFLLHSHKCGNTGYDFSFDVCFVVGERKRENTKSGFSLLTILISVLLSAVIGMTSGFAGVWVYNKFIAEPKMVTDVEKRCDIGMCDGCGDGFAFIVQCDTSFAEGFISVTEG